jgi:hypothetical protein
MTDEIQRLGADLDVAVGAAYAAWEAAVSSANGTYNAALDAANAAYAAALAAQAKEPNDD